MKFITKLVDVEFIQSFHRYTVTAPSRHPITGENYVLYGYDGEPLDDYPHIDDLEYLPEAWLNYLVDLSDDHGDREGFSGSVQEWLDKCKPGSPSLLVQMTLQAIPKEPFGHDRMLSLVASLVNMGTQGEAGVAGALEALRDEWLRGEYNTPEFERDFNLSLAGAIKKFGAIEPRADDILAVDQAAAFARVTDEGFFDAWTELPAVVTPESLAERLRFIVSMALASGLSLAEAAALAWHSPARKEIDPTQAYLETMWAEAHIAEAQPVTEERQFTVEPEAKPEVEPLAPTRKVHLLTTQEEAALQDLTWWGDDKAPGHFMSVMHAMNPVMNEQYYHLNRWMLLSLIFAPKAVIPLENGTSVTLIFYGGVLGPSGVGKSESLNVVTDVASMFYMAEGEDPDIGGDATAAGLTEALIRRDGKSSFFHSDEADAVLLNWSNSMGPFADMKQKVTLFFGGSVPPLNRATKKDISGIRAKAYLCVHLTGVDERIVDAIEPRDWESGFVNRIVWANGYRKPRTREQKKLRIRRPGSPALGPKGQDTWYQQWVAQFGRIASGLSNQDGTPGWIDIDDDVLERHTDTIELFEKLAQNSRHSERVSPTFTRLEMTILKCAALVAITEKRRRVQMSDYLIALEQAEEWTENILELVEATDRPVRAREADKLADLIRRQGGQMKKTEIHALHPGNQKVVNDLLRELEAQGRVEELQPDKTKLSGAIILLTEGK